MKFLKTFLVGLGASLLLTAQMPAQSFYSSCPPVCGQDCCCDPCCCNRYWFDAEYLLWDLKKAPNTIPLVVTGPIPGEANPPVLDLPGYDVVLGDEKLDHRWRSGVRLALGGWFDDCCQWGGEVSYLILPENSRKRSVSSTGLLGSEFLAIPFIDATTGLESSEAIALPGSFAGFARLKVANELQGAELNGLYSFSPACGCCESRFGLLAGFRWWNFDEHLTFSTDSPFVPPVLVTDIYHTRDKFCAQNNFYGGQIGLTFDYKYCDFLFNVKAKVALGSIHHKLKIDGEFVTNDFVGFDPNPAEVFEGGYFAQPTNIGSYKRNKFAVVPEVNINIGYQITDCFLVKLGYNFIYVNRVLRATDQLDRFINPTQSVAFTGDPDAVLVGPAAPLASLKTSTFWAQGLNVGFEFSF